MLALYIQNSDHTQASFASRLGISASYMSDMINGNKRPSLALAFKIETETKGAVPAASWVQAIPESKGAA